MPTVLNSASRPANLEKCSTTPSVLLRFFEEKKHAEAFIAGKVRFGLLARYKTIEDLQRRDSSEGSVGLHWRLNNPVNCERSSLNNYYILCTAHPDANRQILSDRYGPNVVRIHDPAELLRRVETAWQRHPLSSGGRCIIERVTYNKGELVDPTPGLLPPIEYNYSQKPASYSDDREFRYVLTCTADAIKLKDLVGDGTPLNNYLDDLSLGDCSDISSPI